MANANIGVKQDAVRGPAYFKFKRKKETAGRRTLTYLLMKQAVVSFLQGWVSEHSLQVSGFRKGKAPVNFVYRQHKSYIDSLFISLLHEDDSEDINSRMKKAATPLEYKVLPWDGRGDLAVEVSTYLTPSIPDPGRRFDGAASPGASSDDIEPAAGQQHGVADSAEKAISDMSERGIFIGSDLLKQQPGGVGLHWQSHVDSMEDGHVPGQQTPEPGNVCLPDESIFTPTGCPSSRVAAPDVAAPDATPALPEQRLGLDQESAPAQPSKRGDQPAAETKAVEGGARK